jgi:uncharacterized membrane protein
VPYDVAFSATNTDPGWGKLLALIITAGLFYLFTRVWERVKQYRAGTLSPTAAVTAVEGVKPQAGDLGDPNGPPSGPVGQQWGRIDYPGGRSRVAVPPRNAAQPGVPTGPVPAKDLDRWVAGQVGTRSPSQIIREAQRRFRRSPSTVKRSIRRVRGGGGG